MTTLYGFPPMFDTMSASPFVMKADIQLQMLGVTFDRRIANLDSVAKHKAPYVDDGGRIVEDSTFIRWHFEQKLNKDLDAGLPAEKRAIAWGMERMLEDHLHFIMLADRWLDDANFEKGPGQFFAAVPEAARAQVTGEIRATLHAALTRHGILRHSRAERMQLADNDIAAVSALLGDKPYLLGDHPTALDAIAYGELAACATPFFNTPLVTLVAKRENLAPYLKRVEARFFPTPPAYA
jgi:glutathione S-transferase